jgi:hypothetical protein
MPFRQSRPWAKLLKMRAFHPTMAVIAVTGLLGCFAPVEEPWNFDPNEPVVVKPCRAVTRRETQLRPFSSWMILTARPGQYAGVLHDSSRLEVVSSDPNITTPPVVTPLADWPKPFPRTLDFRATPRGYLVLAQEDRRQSPVAAFARLRFEGGAFTSVEPMGSVSRVHRADVAVDGRWLMLLGDQTASLEHQVSTVTTSEADLPLRTFDGGVKAIGLTAPEVISLVDARGPRVLLGAERELELPSCGAPLFPREPTVAPFSGGLIIVQSCTSSMLVSRFGSGLRPERSVELMVGPIASIAAVVDPAGRVVIATSPNQREGEVSVSVLSLDDLSPAREPVSLSECAGGFVFLGLVADPAKSGRYGLEVSKGTGHGSGCAAFTRLELCLPEEER